MRSRMRWAVLALALAGCDPTVFDGLRGNASVFVVGGPTAAAAGQYGVMMASTLTTIGGTPASRYAVAGGPGSAFYGQYGFDGDRPRFAEGSVFELCGRIGCEGGGIGGPSAFAMIPTWAGINSSAGQPAHACVAAGIRASASLQQGSVVLTCEDGPQSMGYVRGAELDFGTGVAGVQVSEHTTAAFFAGAPSGGILEEGRVYRVQQATPLGIPVTPLDLTAAAVPPGSKLGSTLAVGVIGTQSTTAVLRLAIGGQSSDTGRVLVVDVDTAGVATVRACLRGPLGYGGALLVADLDADNQPEVVVGRAAGSPSGDVEIYDGVALAAGSQPCLSTSVQPSPILMRSCAQLARPGVDCSPASNGFGSSLAAGDLDGDNTLDLVIGAPNVTVNRNPNAGAVYALAGSSTGMVGDRFSVLFHSNSRPGLLLGAAVATLRGRMRDELLAGAPGGKEVAIFLCSGISGDAVANNLGPRGCL